MNLDKEFLKKEEEIICRFKESKREDLGIIEPYWAYGLFADKLLDFSLHPINEQYVFATVCLSSLVANAEFFEFDLQHLFTGEELNDHRVSRILFHWENKGYLDPPQISVEPDGIIKFADGRHRTKCAFFLGQGEIPIAFHKSELPELLEVIPLKIWAQ